MYYVCLFDVTNSEHQKLAVFKSPPYFSLQVNFSVFFSSTTSPFSDINECVNSPCRNGATCINTQGAYQCKCKPGFKGNQCEQGKLFTGD